MNSVKFGENYDFFYRNGIIRCGALISQNIMYLAQPETYKKVVESGGVRDKTSCFFSPVDEKLILFP